MRGLFINIAAVTIIISTLTGCSSPSFLAKNYEVLDVPQPSTIYSPGRTWVKGLGPTGPVLGEVIDGAGLATISEHDKSSVSLIAEANIRNLLTGTFGIKASSISNITIQGLRLAQTKDLYKSAAKGRIIYEAVIADSYSLDLDRGAAAVISGQPLKVKGLKIGLNGDVEKKLSVRSADNAPLTVAVKIADISYNDPEIETGSIPAGGIGTSAEIGLGYQATLIKKPNLETGEVWVRLSNPNIPLWQGESVTFSIARPWVNNASRFNIEADADSQVWDRIEISWAGMNINFRVTRQSLHFQVSETAL